jgi:HSP20 family protein
VERLAAERVPATFARQLTLGGGVDLDQIAASYTNGVLTLTLPVAEAAKPRKIVVNSGETESVSISAGDESR